MHPSLLWEISGIYSAFTQIHQHKLLAEVPLAFQVKMKGFAVPL